jgi:hypothetical protein
MMPAQEITPSEAGHLRIKFGKRSETQIEELMKSFIVDEVLHCGGHLTHRRRPGGLNRKTVTAFIARLRRVIARHQERNLAEAFGGEVEVEEFLRGAPSDDKRGRVAPGKVPVFGILERGGKVFAGMIGDTQRETVLPITKRKVTPDGTVYFEADVLRTMRLLSRERGTECDPIGPTVSFLHYFIQQIIYFYKFYGL